MDNSLLDGIMLVETSFQIYWPASFDPKSKIAGPKINRINGNYWQEEGSSIKYNTIEELIFELAKTEEYKRLILLNNEFDQSGI